MNFFYEPQKVRAALEINYFSFSVSSDGYLIQKLMSFGYFDLDADVLNESALN